VTTTTEGKLATVRKLLAKAENPACTEVEAKALNDKAAELIARYGLEEALKTAADPTRDEVGDRVIVIDAPYAIAKSTLLHRIAEPLGCRTVRRRHRPGQPVEVHLFGYDSDMDRVDLLYTSLLVQLALAVTWAPIPPYEGVKAFRRAFMLGFSSAVYKRLTEAEQRARRQYDDGRQDGPSTALVLADRSDQVARRVKAAYPKLVSGSASTTSGSGYRLGDTAGRRADLGGTRVAAGHRRALPGG